MQIAVPKGTSWHIREGAKKLALRGRLPGAGLFDRVAESLRAAKARGLSAGDQLRLALPASWLVNSPAISRVLRRWALPPHEETMLALVELLEGGPAAWDEDEGSRAAIDLAVASLGEEPYVTEAISKVLALLVPDAVPLMPERARAFVLGDGDGAKSGAGAFGAIVAWFGPAVALHREGLDAIARAHAEVTLTAGGVLDRLLWFDSEGHAHFPRVD